MTSTKSKLLLLVLGISAGNLTSCGPAELKKSLEVESGLLLFATGPGHGNFFNDEVLA